MTVRGGTSSLRALRWVIVSIGLALSAVLLLRGSYLIGGLIGVAAVLRVVFLLSSARYRVRSSRTGTRRGPGRAEGRGGGSRGGQAPVRQLLRGLAPRAFEVAAGVIGVNASELRRGFQRSRSIAEAASARGVSVDAVVAAVVSDASMAIDRAVSDGTTSPDVAGRAKDRLPMWAARIVYGTRAELQRATRF